MSPQTRKRARSLLALFLALYAAFTLLPGGVYALYRAQESSPPAGEASPSPAAAQPTATAAPGFLEGRLPATPAPQEDSFTLYDTATGETFTVTAEEFLPAALACEMDLSAPEEALKAQAVALYTFYSYQRAQHQGEAAPAYYETLQQAVAAVKGQRLTWEGEPICAAFFAISGGATESSANVWGQEFPYLQSVASPGDCFASGYLSTVTLTAQELQAAGEAAWGDGVDFSLPREQWFTDIAATPAGYVTSATVGGRLCTGEELREAFGLRSACFTLDTSGGEFQFTVKGWGHGVGMSQAGAAFLANQGASYQEILAHYYPGALLEGAA